MALFFRCPSSVIGQSRWVQEFQRAFLDYRVREMLPTEGGPAMQSGWWEDARLLADAEANRLEKEAREAADSIPPPTG